MSSPAPEPSLTLLRLFPRLRACIASLGRIKRNTVPCQPTKCGNGSLKGGRMARRCFDLKRVLGNRFRPFQNLLWRFPLLRHL